MRRTAYRFGIRRQARRFRPSIQSLEARELLAVTFSDWGFEAAQQTPQGFTYDPTGTPWTFAGTSGVAANGSGFTGNNNGAPEGT